MVLSVRSRWTLKPADLGPNLLLWPLIPFFLIVLHSIVGGHVSSYRFLFNGKHSAYYILRFSSLILQHVK